MNCDYCDGAELVYELETGRGPVRRCIPCLCVERAQPGVGWESFQTLESDSQQYILETVNDYLTILARYRTNETLIERDPDAIGAVGEDTRTFFQNFMSADAHKRPSELIKEGER